jgi:hypothetical protein
LSKDPSVRESQYTVRLYFSELENVKTGGRAFDIAIQDKKVAENFDIVMEAGKPDKEVIKSYPGIRAGRIMKIDLIPVKGNTLISGIELIRETVSDNIKSSE